MSLSAQFLKKTLAFGVVPPLVKSYNSCVDCFWLQKELILHFADKEQKEKYEWERIETSDSIIKDLRSVADTRPQENMWQPLEVTTHDRDSSSYSSYNSRMSPSGNIFDHRSAYDLEQREVEIVANLERDEEAGHNITNNHDCCHDDEKDIYQDQCSSRSTDSVYSSTVASIEARVTLDMQSTLSSSRPPRRSPTERKMLDLEEERRRMERWDAEQEEKRQVGRGIRANWKVIPHDHLVPYTPYISHTRTPFPAETSCPVCIPTALFTTYPKLNITCCMQSFNITGVYKLYVYLYVQSGTPIKYINVH